MIDRGRLSRRRLLANLASGGALVALAGCAESDTGTEADTDANGTESEPPADDDLDLREANVVDVGCEATDGGYAFDVTLHHDDDGEEGYANWWQIERLDGTRLGRRELLHAHSEQPFTRSATVAIPDNIIQVVVRGHDQTHGYGGVAALVAIDDESVRFINQGPEPRSFDAEDFS